MASNLYLAVVFLITFFCACGREPDISETPLPQVAPMPAVVAAPHKKEDIRYVYHGDQRPDPFIPQNIESASVPTGDIVTPNISALSLKGIFAAGKQKTAIITAGGLTYILKDSRLYDNRQRMIKGLSGAIKTDSVIMIAQDKTMRELKLRDKE